MDQNDLKAQLQVLIAEYRVLNRDFNEAAPDDRKAVMQQMHDNVRRQNALREQLKQLGE